MAALIAAAASPQAMAQQARPTGKPAPAAAASDGALKSRVESLEEQLVDMQVVVGTLESMSKSAGGAAPAFAASAPGGGDGRVEALERQIQALTAQVEQLSDQVRALGGTPRRADAGGAYAAAPPAAGAFGSTTVTPGGADAIGGLIDTAPPPGVPPAASTANAYATTPPAAATDPGGYSAGQPPVATAALPPASDGDPKQMYETAYGYLLQRDYGSAETAFTEFVQKFPTDSLAGNAQYWLGETYFVRGQYKAAAGAFLKGYQTYAQNSKAPDSLLKLAMSLDRLGQKDAACASYGELTTKFPNAAQSVKARAQSERQRVGCH